MKKTFYFKVSSKKPGRQVESIRQEINKYISREKRKQIPDNADYWGFDCKIGESDDSALVIHIEEISSKITELASKEIESFYLEILAKPESRQKKDNSEKIDTQD